MPHVMLKRNWPGVFRRTIETRKGEPETLEFKPGVPVNLTARQVKLLTKEIGTAIFPVEMDPKERPKAILEDVVPEEPKNESEQTDI